MKIPPPQHTIAALVDKHHESLQERPRPHLGASQLGHHCERWLWLNFRWAIAERFSGRMLRLFRRGQMEEDTIIADLEAIGIQFESTQARVKFGCHVSGSADGVIREGVPGAEKKRHVAEFKTHNKASFNALEKKGVKESKPQHWAQMQVYMLGLGIDRALYIAICKDDDRLYAERVRLDADAAQALVEKGKRIALSERMPPPLSKDPTHWLCKMCAGHAFCHGDAEPERNCRTCAHVVPTEGSTWLCNLHGNQEIPTDFQRVGCDEYWQIEDLHKEHR
jgi:hypothetical protein